jgi:hypothetical protein
MNIRSTCVVLARASTSFAILLASYAGETPRRRSAFTSFGREIAWLRWA